MLRRLKIDQWDMLIVGDGSGSVWTRSIGWGSVSIDRETRTREIWYGTANKGTGNFAEIMAYVQPLEWLMTQEQARRKNKKKPIRAQIVHIITDSKYCQERGSSGHLQNPANIGLWAALNAYSRLGFVLKWHQRNGGDVELNRFVDKLSKLARTRGLRYNLRMLTEEARGKSVSEHNPDED